jgi:hypothetical protein
MRRMQSRLVRTAVQFLRAGDRPILQDLRAAVGRGGWLGSGVLGGIGSG